MHPGFALIPFAFATMAGLETSAQPALQPGAGGDDGMVEWLDDYDLALAEARRSGRPIFLEFRCSP